MKPSHLKQIVFAILAIAALAALYSYGRHNRASTSLGIASGTHPMAPDFSLPELTGQKLALSDYRGKVVLLDFWATWCAPCREEIPHFVNLQNKYGTQGFQVVGVSMDDGPEPVRDFYRQFKMNYPVVMGNAETGQLYGGVLGLPIAYVVDRDGRIYTKHIGITDISVFEREVSALLQANLSKQP